MTTLKLQDVTISFGGVMALKEVDFAVSSGAIRGLIGPNGAGKSTLLNVVCGLNRPDRGSVAFQNVDLLRLKPHQIAAQGISRTFQRTRLFTGMSVLENVMTGLHHHLHTGFIEAAFSLRRMRLEEERARLTALEALRFVGMEQFSERFATDLSHGQQRLVELARALVSSPALLLLDEPAAGLSLPRVAALAELLCRIRDEMGITIILVEHVIRLVMGISDQVTVLNYGEKIAEGPPEEIRRDKQVIEAYLGQEIEHAGD
jgi:branched-chain amino acid transport system ATP-binding protein